jgi:hypothetical protein
MPLALRCKSSFGDSYSFSFDKKEITVDAYLLGSITGGTGTEKKSEIKGAKLQQLLAEYEAISTEDLHRLVETFSTSEVDQFILSVSKYEDLTFIWSETDWSDEK